MAATNDFNSKGSMRSPDVLYTSLDVAQKHVWSAEKCLHPCGPHSCEPHFCRPHPSGPHPCGPHAGVIPVSHTLLTDHDLSAMALARIYTLTDYENQVLSNKKKQTIKFS